MAQLIVYESKVSGSFKSNSFVMNKSPVRVRVPAQKKKQLQIIKAVASLLLLKDFYDMEKTQNPPGKSRSI